MTADPATNRISDARSAQRWPGGRPTLRLRTLRAFERRVANRLIRTLVVAGRAPKIFAVIETVGRNSGRPRVTPVGNGLVGDRFWIVAEQGLDADYVRNIQKEPRVRVCTDGTWRSGLAILLFDDDPIARTRAHPFPHDAAFLRLIIRAIGSRPVTIKVDLDEREV
jgi:deazaflavin-dependent oxidoreductase (nitroreductase family)